MFFIIEYLVRILEKLYLEGLKKSDIIRNFAELIGAKIQFHHVDPRSDIER